MHLAVSYQVGVEAEVVHRQVEVGVVEVLLLAGEEEVGVHLQVGVEVEEGVDRHHHSFLVVEAVQVEVVVHLVHHPLPVV